MTLYEQLDCQASINNASKIPDPVLLKYYFAI